MSELRKTYTYRLHPTRGQARLLEAMLEECRWVYNETLATRKQTYEQTGKTLALYDTFSLLPDWKAARPTLKRVHSQVLQNVQARVDLAFNAFFRRLKAGEKKIGFPRFKGFGRYDSLTYPQYGNGVRVDAGRVILSKIGAVACTQHRPITGAIKTATLRRSGKKWFISFSTQQPYEKPATTLETAVGIDVGLEKFATLSSGETIANPRFGRRDERDLKRAQRRLSAATKGTTERVKRRQIVARIHERIANRRKDFAHQLSRRLVNEFGVVVFEDLAIARMLRNHRLAKSIADAAWNQLITYTTYKAEEAGRCCVLVDAGGTSQRCSQCDRVVKKGLSVRVHDCPHCGLNIDRDLNAAYNILRLGLQSQGTLPHEAAAFWRAE